MKERGEECWTVCLHTCSTVNGYGWDWIEYRYWLDCPSGHVWIKCWGETWHETASRVSYLHRFNASVQGPVVRSRSTSACPHPASTTPPVSTLFRGTTVCVWLVLQVSEHIWLYFYVGHVCCLISRNQDVALPQISTRCTSAPRQPLLIRSSMFAFALQHMWEASFSLGTLDQSLNLKKKQQKKPTKNKKKKRALM